jgi:hypothetical protein
VTDRSVFWDDLAADLKDPDFRRMFLIERLKLELLRQAKEQDTAMTMWGRVKCFLGVHDWSRKFVPEPVWGYAMWRERVRVSYHCTRCQARR